MTLLMIVANQLAPDDGGEDARALELLLVRLQSQYLVGVGRLTGQSETVLGQVAALNVGSVARRQRYIALVAELGGAQRAADATAELDELLTKEAAREGGGASVSETEAAIQQIFRELFAEAGGEYLARLDDLDETKRELLREELGWFAGAILHPEGSSDAPAREQFLAPTTAVALVILGGFSLLALAGLGGLAILVTMAILVHRGRVRSGLHAARGGHAIYAETFALWIVSFIGLSFLGGLLSERVPALGLWPSLAGFLLSLLALRWPVRRGIPWSVVREEIGLHPGRRPWIELVAGVGGYLGALPLLAVGMTMTLLLLRLQGWISPPAGPFDAAAEPAHPIVFQLAGSSIWLKLQLLLLASVAAPLVEETMFRGVLYRHLRESSRRRGILLSILLSGGVSSLLFAAIHPQGWLAVPALMSLAFSFVLLREWRGSLLPSMVLHGISNGVVMVGLFALLGMS